MPQRGHRFRSRIAPIDFERLTNLHKDAVYRQLIRMCGDYDDAEDALVEALISAYRASGQLQDEGAFQAWLAAIARRACTRLKQRNKFGPLVDLSEIDVASVEPDPAEEGMMRDCIRTAVDSLDPKYREVYELCELQDVDAKDAARRLGLTLPAVKSRLLRAKEKVRLNLDQGLCGSP